MKLASVTVAIERSVRILVGILDLSKLLRGEHGPRMFIGLLPNQRCMRRGWHR